MSTYARRRCGNCEKLTYKWHRINGGPWHCYDGCYSTTGWDRRSPNGQPLAAEWKSTRGKSCPSG